MKLPTISKGTVMPSGIHDSFLREEKEREAIRQQRRHDFLIATYGIIGGIIGGAISSVIVLLLEGSL